MKQCGECTARIDFYLDDELRGEELDGLELHVKNCTSCQEHLWSRRLYLERVRLSRPLYTAPAALRERVERLFDEHAAAYSDTALQPPVKEVMVKERVRSWTSFPWLRPIPAFATMGLAVVGLLALSTFSQQEARATAFVDMAVKTHQQQLSGRIPIEVKTDSPAEVAGWFADKLPFPFRLPTYQEGSGQMPPYKLIGGRLITYGGEYAAYVAYHMNNSLVSLIVTSARSSLALGGETTVTKGLTFHSHQQSGLEIVTWSVHNLSYALVSSITLPARQSCAVCHLRPSDRGLLRDIH